MKSIKTALGQKSSLLNCLKFFIIALVCLTAFQIGGQKVPNAPMFSKHDVYSDIGGQRVPKSPVAFTNAMKSEIGGPQSAPPRTYCHHVAEANSKTIVNRIMDLDEVILSANEAQTAFKGDIGGPSGNSTIPAPKLPICGLVMNNALQNYWTSLSISTFHSRYDFDAIHDNSMDELCEEKLIIT